MFKFYKSKTSLKNLKSFNPSTMEKFSLGESIKPKKNLKTTSMVKMKSFKPARSIFKT